jgi:hypothetical protein
MSDYLGLVWGAVMVLGLLGLFASFFAAHDPRWRRRDQLEVDAEADEDGRSRAYNHQRRRRQA